MCAWGRYSFGAGDLKICADIIQTYTADCPVVNGRVTEVPWDDLRYLIVEVMYGGHITDPFDRRICVAQLESLFGAAVVSGEQAELIAGLGVPPVQSAGSVQQLQDYVQQNFPAASPRLFGLHRNAEMSVLEVPSMLRCWH